MIKQEIENILANAAKKAGYDGPMSVSFSALPQICDFQCNSCFAIAKMAHKNPVEVANEIVSAIQENECYDFSVAKPAFINIKLTEQGTDYLANKLLQQGDLPSNGKTIFLDYGGPNIGKAMHVGHMRSFNIGEALKRLYKKLGYNVICDIFLGDWGMPMGLIMAMLEREQTLPDYIYGKRKLTIEVMNEAYPKASRLKGEDEQFKSRAEQLTLAFQRKTEPYYGFWKKLRAVSVAEVEAICRLLNVEFDLWNGESTASEYVGKVIEIFKNKSLARISDGALIVDVAQEGEQIPIPKKTPDEVQRFKNPMPPIILQKSNGGDKYETSDIATIYLRNKLYHPDVIHYLTDARQNQRFIQIFRACKKAGISPEGQQLWHTGFGTINGKDGKALKTRDGGNMQLVDLLNAIYEKAEQKLKENGTLCNDELKRKIGNAAIKFADLMTNVEKDVIFDMDKVLAFEGKTGPYIQYTACRIKSILQKAGEFEQTQHFLPEHKNVILALNKLQASYQTCFEEKSLSGLCGCLYAAASEFASFYSSCHILSEGKTAVKNAHLSLLHLVLKKLTEASEILGIEIPEKM